MKPVGVCWSVCMCIQGVFVVLSLTSIYPHPLHHLELDSSQSQTTPSLFHSFIYLLHFFHFLPIFPPSLPYPSLDNWISAE